MMPQQLPLAVQLPDDETFSSFVEGNNSQVVQHLQSLADNSASELPFLTYLGGESGQGKSHLLYAVCHACLETGTSHIYLDLNQRGELSGEILTGLENVSLICLDNVHSIASEHTWQVAVFDLINRVKEQQNSHLLISSVKAPQHLSMTLPDLGSRLNWGLYYHLQPLDDELRQEALMIRAARRGMSMSSDVARFMTSHLKRDMPSLMSALDTLDNRSLMDQRKLTVPFVKSVLSL